MKKLILLLTLLSFTSVFAQENFKMKEFNQKLHQDIDKVLENNPQLYETKPMVKKGRGPASVAPTSEELENERYQEKFDKNLGLKGW